MPWEAKQTLAALERVWEGWQQDLFPTRESCTFCGHYGRDSPVLSGICRPCREAWYALRRDGRVCPRCGSFTWGSACLGPCVETQSDWAAESGGLRGVCSAVPYSGMYRQGMMAFKYNGLHALAVPYGCLMAMAWRQAGPFAASRRDRAQGLPLLVPVPLFPAKEKARGYNQSYLLATEVGKRLGWPVADILARTQAGQSQAGLDRQKRHIALTRVFSLRKDTPLPPKAFERPVVIVDDVITTGTTLEVCSRLLHEAGFSTVAAMVFAGSDGRKMQR